MLRLFCRTLWTLIYPILKLLEAAIQRPVKPTGPSFVLGTLAGLT
jgi:hypothetical protein